MKNLLTQCIVCSIVFFATTIHGQENSNQDLPDTKTINTKSLNALELEKVKAIIHADKIHPSASAKDTISEKSITAIKMFKTTSILNSEIQIDSHIVKQIIAIKDSILNTAKFTKEKIDSNSPNIVIQDSLSFQNDLISRDTVVKRKYSKAELLADSIRNANKYWLDSTISALPKTKPVIIKPNDEIEIFISGGGFFAGINPTFYDRLTIFHTGLVRRESKTKLQGEQLVEKKISNDALTKLAQFIINQGFFEFNYLYDCHSNDKECNTRLNMDPIPTPLTLSVAIGPRRNKIYVTLYAPKMESNWVNYPKNLEKIVDAIYSIIH